MVRCSGLLKDGEHTGAAALPTGSGDTNRPGGRPHENRNRYARVTQTLVRRCIYTIKSDAGEASQIGTLDVDKDTCLLAIGTDGGDGGGKR